MAFQLQRKDQRELWNKNSWFSCKRSQEQYPSPDGQNKREPWDQLSPLFRQNWRKKTETGFSRANFFFQVWRNLFAGGLTVPGNYLNLLTWQWFSFYSKAFFFTNFKGWLWLIRDLYFLSKQTLCHVHLMSRAIEMLKKEFLSILETLLAKILIKESN